MLATSLLYPEFVVPLAREQGVEMWLLQWARPTAAVSTVLFTPLAAYHARGTYAQPALILTHYADLLGTHAVALMRGERTDPAASVLTADEAKVLVWRLQRFYNTSPATEGEGSRYRRLLEDFHRPRGRDEAFDIEGLAKLAYEV
jgi:ATP synthase F1 complex assembly factor 1